MYKTASKYKFLGNMRQQDGPVQSTLDKGVSVVDNKTHKGGLIDNPSQRCACVLVVDTSMRGQPVDELNKCVSQFIHEMRSDEMAAVSVELGMVTAGREAQEEMPITPILNVGSAPLLQAGEGRSLGGAVEMALNMLDNCKQEYKSAGVPYYQPWLVIISDGEPTDDWQSVAVRAKKLADAKKLVVLSVGVSGADMNILSQFSSQPARALDGLKFKEFFVWLSESMVSVLRSTTANVPLPPANSSSAISESAPSVPSSTTASKPLPPANSSSAIPENAPSVSRLTTASKPLPPANSSSAISESAPSVPRSTTASKPLPPANNWSAISESATSVPHSKPSKISLEVSFEVSSSSKMSFKALFEVPSPDEWGSNCRASKVSLSPASTQKST